MGLIKNIDPQVGEILKALAYQTEVYLSGGALRDLLLGRPFKDIDLTVRGDSSSWARFVAEHLGGRVVVLHQEEGVVRVACTQGVIDLSSFRQGAQDIQEDLRKRDFTVNALAVPLAEALAKPLAQWEIIDPTQGLADLRQKVLRAIARNNLEDDPLRLLRGYRLLVELGFTLFPETRAWIRDLASTLEKVARERVGTELLLILENPNAHKAFYLLEEDTLLGLLFPELEAGRGVPQPGFHHLDVLGHNLLALEKADLLLEDPGKFFGDASPFKRVCNSLRQACIVRLAALLHDVGKPATFALRQRITFYEHDRVGAEMVEEIGRRWRWSKKFTKEVALLVRHHMRPFHLLRESRLGRLTPRALRRLLRACPDYPALFLVAMADSLASAGPDKEPDVEDYLVELFWEVHRFYEERLVPATERRLVTGSDLIELFGLEPGPLFRELLEAVEEARVEGRVTDRKQALALIERLIKEKFSS